jgi:hypothetical protein
MAECFRGRICIGGWSNVTLVRRFLFFPGQRTAQRRGIVAQDGIEKFALFDHPSIHHQGDLVSQLDGPLFIASFSTEANENRLAVLITVANELPFGPQRFA